MLQPGGSRPEPSSLSLRPAGGPKIDRTLRGNQEVRLGRLGSRLQSSAAMVRALQRTGRSRPKRACQHWDGLLPAHHQTQQVSVEAHQASHFCQV